MSRTKSIQNVKTPESKKGYGRQRTSSRWDNSTEDERHAAAFDSFPVKRAEPQRRSMVVVRDIFAARCIIEEHYGAPIASVVPYRLTHLRGLSEKDFIAAIEREGFLWKWETPK